MRILIVEGDDGCPPFDGSLIRQGFDTVCCKECDLVGMPLPSFDLIIISSEQENSDLLRWLKRHHTASVMVLSNYNSCQKRIEAYQNGVDDFLEKPVNPTELVLRINIILQRNTTNYNLKSSIISIDQLKLNKAKQLVTFSGKNLVLTPLQFRLLWQLVVNRHQVLSKSYLYKTVLDRDFCPYDRSLDMHLSRVRKKLVELGMLADRLVTVHGKGYRFS